MPLGKRLALLALAVVATLYLVGPPLWMLISSVSPDAELRSRPPHWLPHNPTTGNYRTLFQLPGSDATILRQNPQIGAFPRSAANSFLVASATTLLCLLMGSLAGYTLARLVPGRARRTILFGLLVSRMIPVAAIIIPIYVGLQKLGLLNSLSGLVLAYTGLLLPFVIWILEGFFRDFPTELEEAARIDGCSPLGTLIRVVLPLSKNALFAAGAFVFISVWSDFLVGLSLTTSEAAWPISVALAQALNPITEPSWGLLNSAGLAAALVPAILALVFRKAVMRGMLSGAIKG